MNDTALKAVGDVGAIGTAWAALAGWVPAVAALFTLVWTGLRIWRELEDRGWVRNTRKGDRGGSV